ncbi:MAG TPA: hypothetical protein VK249_19320 [Anaerolineales bacterium]|nr:hypothetical protein [Anaerolineales bacterium]
MKISVPKNRLWLCLPIIVTDLLDATVTMLGQPPEYWQGSHNAVSEFNPFARWFMVIHPLGAAVYILLDIAVISFLIIVLPLALSKILSAFWAIGSAKAIYNWLVGPLQMGWWISNLVILIPTVILVYAFDKASANQVSTDREQGSISVNLLRKRD